MLQRRVYCAGRVDINGIHCECRDRDRDRFVEFTDRH
jgi:hypothetical protein